MSNATQVAAHMALVERYSFLREHGTSTEYEKAGTAVEASASQLSEQPGFVPCKGTNCGITRADQAHSPECNDEHEAACKFDPLDTAGNRHHEFRYAGYKGQPLKTGCTADQAAAYREGVRAAARPLTAATSAPTAVEPDERDTERMNWLDNNIFHVEPDEWTAKYSPHLNTWRIFAPKGVQGSARAIIDAARALKGTP